MTPKRQPNASKEQNVFMLLFYLFALLTLHIFSTHWLLIDITNNNIFGLITGAVGYFLGQKINSP